jgi:predicted acyltransferase
LIWRGITLVDQILAYLAAKAANAKDPISAAGGQGLPAAEFAMIFE